MRQIDLQDLTLNSLEVAKMVGKAHSKLLRDIRTYIGYLGEANFGLSDFFRESSYLTEQNKKLPCYEVTKKGCELIAHKLTGQKGILFTATYINRFHDMENELKGEKNNKVNEQMPWFIRKFIGKYIILERDFIDITGVDIKKHKLFYRSENFKGGLDYNGYGWRLNREEFKAKYGFDYGDDNCMLYFYPCGAIKALEILSKDSKVKMKASAKELILNGINSIRNKSNTLKASERTNKAVLPIVNECGTPIQVNVYLPQRTVAKWMNGV